MKGAVMQRREFVALLGGAAAAAWPLAAGAQQSAMPVVGYLYSGSPETSAQVVAPFRKGLSEAGYVEGRNVAIEYRFAQNDSDRLPELAADLVRRRVAVIVTPGTPASILAAKAATNTIPIIFRTGVDPVQTGFVASLNRPGGNVTGVNSMQAELGARQLGLLHELIPGAARFGVLVNPANPNAEPVTADVQAAAASIGRHIEIFSAGSIRDIDAVFKSLVQKRVDGLLIGPNGLFTNRRVQLVILGARYLVPAIYTVRDYAEIGGLMSYGASSTDQHRLAGIYTGRVLKGEKPTDMPVMRATKFEFMINLQTARTLGFEVPPTLLALADEVIE
jgi:putative ABC transport system substrate-binding protein